MSMLYNFFRESALFAPSEHDKGSLAGKVYVVTGGLAGIGEHTTLQLALRGATVFAGARSAAKALPVLEALEKQYPEIKGRIKYFHVDFATMAGARKGGETVLGMTDRIDGLCNNAGRILLDANYTLSDDGIELFAQVNHFGTFVFTETLLPLLIKTAKEPNSDVRIVNIASGAAEMVPAGWNFSGKAVFNDKLSDDKNLNSFSSVMNRYAVSKLYNVLMAKELQNRLTENCGIIVLSLHPGSVATDKLLQYGFFVTLLVKTLFLIPSKGAYTSIFALTAPEIKKNPKDWEGAYLVPFGRKKDAVPRACDILTQRRLWEVTEEIVKAGGIKVD